MEFRAKGHTNILSTHKKTLEFTKDDFVTLKGDCIVGICSDFSYSKLQDLLKYSKGIIKITGAGITETITGRFNKDFCSEHEIVCRKSNFISERTLMIHCDKASSNLDRDLIRHLKEGKEITIEINPLLLKND